MNCKILILFTKFLAFYVNFFSQIFNFNIKISTFFSNWTLKKILASLVAPIQIVWRYRNHHPSPKGEEVFNFFQNCVAATGKG